MSIITNKWNDGSGDSINIESPSFQGNQTVKISSPVQKGTSKRSMKFIGKCKKDSSKQVILTVEQEASTYTYDLTLNSDNTEIAAKGGTATITAVLKTYRNGNLVSTDNVTPVLSGSATGFSISGTTVTASNRTTVVGAERSITVTGKYSGTYDGQEVSATVVVKQSLNEVVALKAIPTTGNDTILSYDSAVAASGGTVAPRKTGAANLTYSSGSTLYDSSGGSVAGGYLSFSRTNTRVSGILSIASNGDATGSNLGTVISSETETVVAATIKATFTRGSDVLTDSRTDNVVVKQEANTATYGTITISGGTVADIPASGGKISSMSGISASQTVSYTSGATRDGNVSISYSSAVSASSLGTTVKARTKVGQLTVTYTGEGGVTANKTVDIYQAENKVTNSNYNPRITAYGTPTISIGSGLTAAGGSATVSASVTNTETYNALYSSGATGPNQTRSVGGSLSISMTANGNSRFSLSGNTITHSSMGTNETTDTITIKAVNDGDSSKSATASKSITNSKTVKSTSGGIYTYGDVIAGTISNKTIPASGGSATATAGNGSQTWNKSATITTYEYTSGATKDITTEAASNGTANVVPNVSSITATASSKGTTVSAQTTVKSQAVIWSANGKSAIRVMYIYQAANEIVSYNYTEWKIVLRANPTTIPASGGTSQLTNSATRDRIPVYTSGATGSSTTVSSIPSLSISGDGFTLANNIVTASKNNVGARSCIVTASREGATSKSVTITQLAGPDGIGYMQIEGDGKSHPIFRVGGNTRSVEPMSINETSETASDEDVSIFASIKKFLTKFV